MLKTRFYSNCFARLSGTNTQGSQDFIPSFSFTCRQSNMVQILIDCMCVTENPFFLSFIVRSPTKIQQAITYFLAGEFRQQPALSNCPANTLFPCWAQTLLSHIWNSAVPCSPNDGNVISYCPKYHIRWTWFD